MALEPRKVFVGGLPRSVVTPDVLRAHFARYGEVVDAVAMLNPEDGRGRGFGFVEFSDEAAVLRALDWRERDRHVFDGRRVEVKRAQTKSVQAQSPSCNPNANSKKIFVGGLRDSITKEHLTVYFEKFGTITDVVVMHDRITKKPRGFGFVTFDSEEIVNKVLENRFHDLSGTKVETKMAEPRDQNQYHNVYRSPASSYGGMYSPYNVPYLIHNGHYFFPAYPYIYAPHGYAYMMNQGSSMVYGYDHVSASDLGQPCLNPGSDNKMSGNRQIVDIYTPADMKSSSMKSNFDCEQDSVTTL